MILRRILRIRANALGITAQDYDADRISLDDLYPGATEIDAAPGDVSKLFEDGSIPLLAPREGERWYENEYLGVATSQLDRQYRLFYGGIDSDGVTKRATEMTALMSTVVEALPLQMACVLVAIEFAYRRHSAKCSPRWSEPITRPMPRRLCGHNCRTCISAFSVRR